MCIPLTDIFNTMLESNTYPAVWKRAEIRPLNKVKNPTKLSDYRPISLLHHIGKVAEDVILQRLRTAVADKIQRNQYAYQSGLSTTDALLHAVHDWCLQLDNQHVSHVTAALIDMSKAFDRMDPNILIHKLHKLKVNQGLINLIDNFLSNRQCCVKLNHQSSYISISMGAPQGTKLGPWLWLIYINDLTVEADCKLIKYADDLTVYTGFLKSAPTATLTIQKSLDLITDWAKSNNMLVNAAKTKVLHLTLSEPKYEPSLSMNGQPLESCQTAKILGVTVDKRLLFTDHINNTCDSIAGKLYAMRELKRVGLSTSGLLLYYTANIRSVITYASPVWGSLISSKAMQRVTQIERQALKIIHADLSYKQALSILCIPPIELYIDENARNTMAKIYSNPGHPLKTNIKENTGRRTRVSLSTNMPVCRTSKLKNSFFYKYGNF
jgi:hypothetical protein